MEGVILDKLFQILILGAFGAWAFVVKKGVEKVDVIADKLDKISERLARLEERVALHQQEYFRMLSNRNGD